MRSSVYDFLPPKVGRSLTKFGADLAMARRKRHVTTAMMSERLGVYASAATMLGAEPTDPGEHDYTDIVDALRKHGAAAQTDIEELWRRIALRPCARTSSTPWPGGATREVRWG